MPRFFLPIADRRTSKIKKTGRTVDSHFAHGCAALLLTTNTIRTHAVVDRVVDRRAIQLPGRTGFRRFLINNWAEKSSKFIIKVHQGGGENPELKKNSKQQAREEKTRKILHQNSSLTT